MTDKQFAGICGVLTGAALFIGGAVLLLESEGWGGLSMLIGLFLMVNEPLVNRLRALGDGGAREKEKEEKGEQCDPN